MTNSDGDAAAGEQLVEVAVDVDGVVIVPDSSEVVDELYARVKERGYVTTGEIFAALPKLEPETQELADIYASFNARGVQVIDEIEEELRAEDANRGRPTPEVPAPPPLAPHRDDEHPGGSTRIGGRAGAPHPGPATRAFRGRQLRPGAHVPQGDRQGLAAHR